VEKYLKARLVEAGRPVPKIHSLTAPLDLVLPLEPLWEIFRGELGYLSVFAVAARYPGSSLERANAKDALRCCRRFRTAARTALRIADGSSPRAKRRK
jgi:HEPN domain-containing protein